MCGITGILDTRGAPVAPDRLRRMNEALVHRGPDADGIFVDGPVGLASRRLAIIDLSPAGRQPLASEDGQTVVVYNGEVYDFEALRRELEDLGHRFRSRTDSEVVVHAYEEWGDACVERLNGMFAFAVWDARRSRLALFRDRFGIKPLYWLFRDGVLLFASEVKALLEHPDVRADLCYPALVEYFTFQNVLSDLTLFEGVRMLPPGSMLQLRAEAGAQPTVTRWWDCPPPDPELAGIAPEDAAEELHRRMEAAVHRQLVSDVPLGSYLSGGLDSGFIAALAAPRLPRMTTFTGGFDLSSVSGLELGFDERGNAEQLSNLLKTEHYEVVLHAGDMEWVLPSLVWHLEDLRVGQSYPNYYVARLASKFVSVVLSGAGGDELLGGYPWRYAHAAAAAGSRDFHDRYFSYWQRLTDEPGRARLLNEETRRRADGHDPRAVFDAVLAGWRGPLETREDFVAAALYFELKTFLHGLLVVEDKLSMAHSLETRLPFLDHDVVDFAARLPIGLKVRRLDRLAAADENVAGQRHVYELTSADGKAVLRDAIRKTIPTDAAERIKRGFSAPDASWFRGESIEYIETVLGRPDAMLYEFLSRDAVRDVLEAHTSGRVNRRLLIWSLLSFEIWCRCFLRGEEPSDVGASVLGEVRAR